MRRPGSRRFGGGAEEGESRKIEGLADFPMRMQKTAPNLLRLDMPNSCVLKLIFFQLNSNFKPTEVK
jgi:hypothetical protein